jgi:hypothetical protein
MEDIARQEECGGGNNCLSNSPLPFVIIVHHMLKHKTKLIPTEVSMSLVPFPSTRSRPDLAHPAPFLSIGGILMKDGAFQGRGRRGLDPKQLKIALSDQNIFVSLTIFVTTVQAVTNQSYLYTRNCVQ